MERSIRHSRRCCSMGQCGRVAWGCVAASLCVLTLSADDLIVAKTSDKPHPGNPPQLKGQLFHYFESPNRFGLPAFYTLHVWAWKDNPNGAFVNWHPDVSCQQFNTTE